MSNLSIINHMLAVLDRCEAKEITPAQVGIFLGEYAWVLEGLEPAARTRLDALIAATATIGQAGEGETELARWLAESRAFLVALRDAGREPDIRLDTE